MLTPLQIAVMASAYECQEDQQVLAVWGSWHRAAELLSGFGLVHAPGTRKVEYRNLDGKRRGKPGRRVHFYELLRVLHAQDLARRCAWAVQHKPRERAYVTWKDVPERLPASPGVRLADGRWTWGAEPLTDGAMVERIAHRAGFPARMQRWCTKELKLQPLRQYHNACEADPLICPNGADTVCVVGIRAQESEARARFCEWEDDEMWGGWMWRPILRWSVEEVLAIHHRHGIEVNPLYKRGHDRVGCYPCIFANKEEIRLVAEHAPWRIDEIRTLERTCIEQRRGRNEVQPGRYAYPDNASFFQTRTGDTAPMAIDEVVTWSRTSYGGRQLPMFEADPTGGCFRWNLCEPPTRDPGDGEASR